MNSRFTNFRLSAVVFTLVTLILSGCSSSQPKGESKPAPVVQSGPPFPFKNLKDDQQMALKAFTKGETCPSGQKFGTVARELQFVIPTIDEIEDAMKVHDCKKKVDVLRGLDNQPYKTPKGNTIPLWEWLCGDGTVVRIKPFGDPTSKFNRKPHGSVAMRYPCDAPYNSFDDEMFKVDTNGNPIPKWARDLDASDPDVIETWAHSAHFSVIITRKLKR